jgi:hypothetical protein
MTLKSTETARFVLAASIAAAMIIVPGCATPKPHAEPTVDKSSPPPAPPSQATIAPKLVVLIVLDQLGSWVLDQQLPLLSSGSAIRRAYEDGASHVAEFPYASTQTAPGHASLTTGVTPAVHGIVANAVYVPDRGGRKTVDDGKHAVLGNPDRYVSPTQLRAETVADVLHRESNAKARIVGLSMKGRSAVLPVGQKANIAVFYDAVARAMTTSTYYAPKRRLPEWLRNFTKANPVEPLLQTWEPADPEWLEKHLGPDAWPGEMYPTFPHDPREAPNPLEARGPVAFLLTADHGVAELPERAHAEGRAGGRLRGETLTTSAEQAADAALGEGDWIAGYVPPLFTYTAAGKARHEELSKALRKAMPDVDGVKAVYDARDPLELRSSNNDIERLVGASLPDDPPGDLYLITEPGWFDALSEQGGTNHGTPWDYDRRVPILMWGAAVERRTSQDVHDVLRVATTLAALLDVPAPANAPKSPLPGVMRLPD